MEIDYLKKKMSEKSDEELIKIINFQKDQYTNIGYECARKELDNRRIDTLTIKKILEKINEDVSLKNKIKDLKPHIYKRVINGLIDYSIIIFVILVLNFFLKEFPFKVSLAFFFLYFIALEYKFQKTIGKFITNTKVVSENGNNPSLKEVIGRTYSRLIPLEFLSFILPYWENFGLHDILSKTTVINDTPQPNP